MVNNAQGMTDLRRAIADGQLTINDALTMLSNAHDRMFGEPPSERSRGIRDGMLAADLMSSGREDGETAPLVWLAQSVTDGRLSWEEAVGIAADRAVSRVNGPEVDSYANQVNSDEARLYENYRRSYELAIANRLDVLLDEKNHSRERSGGLER